MTHAVAFPLATDGPAVGVFPQNFRALNTVRLATALHCEAEYSGASMLDHPFITYTRSACQIWRCPIDEATLLNWLYPAFRIIRIGRCGHLLECVDALVGAVRLWEGWSDEQ